MSGEAGGSAVLQHAQDTLDGRALRLLREALPSNATLLIGGWYQGDGYIIAVNVTVPMGYRQRSIRHFGQGATIAEAADEAWLELASKATAGPWTTDEGQHGISDVVCWQGQSMVTLATDATDEDAAFTAAARSALPELIAEVEVLRTAAQRMVTARDSWLTGTDDDIEGAELDAAHEGLRATLEERS